MHVLLNDQKQCYFKYTRFSILKSLNLSRNKKLLDICDDKTFQKKVLTEIHFFLTCNEQAVYDQDASPSLVKHTDYIQGDREEKEFRGLATLCTVVVQFDG